MEATGTVKRSSALGPDCQSLDYLLHGQVLPAFSQQLADAMNNLSVPDYIFRSRAVLLSKNGKTQASLEEARLICVQSVISKIMDSAIFLKLEKMKSGLLTTNA